MLLLRSSTMDRLSDSKPSTTVPKYAILTIEPVPIINAKLIVDNG